MLVEIAGCVVAEPILGNHCWSAIIGSRMYVVEVFVLTGLRVCRRMRT